MSKKDTTRPEATQDDGFMDEDDESLGMEDDTEPTLVSEEERDEVEEVLKMSRKDTVKVQLSRFAATFALLLTALAVTFTTYKFLKKEETDNFVNAFEQFSRTVGDAAIGQQRDLRDGIEAFTDFLSQYARGNNFSWPFVYIDGFEIYARDYLNQAHTEMCSFFPKVYPRLKDQYLEFANSNVQSWIQESHRIQKGSFERLTDPTGNASYHPYISRPTPQGFLPEIDRDDYYLPSWHLSPPPSSYGLVNWNMQSTPDYAATLPGIHELRNETLCTKVRPYVGAPVAMTEEEHQQLHSKLRDSDLQNPHSFCFHPIHRRATDPDSEIVGVLGMATAWDEALLDLLPSNVKGVIAVLRNDCNQSYTYDVQGRDAVFLGEGDSHEPKYDDMEVVVPLNVHTHPQFTSTPGHCQYAMHIYPSSEFEGTYSSGTPEIFAGIVAATFVIVAIFFFGYDVFVQQRNRNLVHKAAKSEAIVTNLFPSYMRERVANQVAQDNAAKKSGSFKTFLNDGRNKIAQPNKPMADLFLETTVLFADISGFTAWSSVREPTQVFVLLETLYSHFDRIAKKRRVFKVETVGDCYVAVCGVPTPTPNHAALMCRFARDILTNMQVTTQALEVTLGPDTGNLGLRVGIHSGPVTGGVLRGERARFQLFGDTMNTCGRIENSGRCGRIHCSQQTAELLKDLGKESWLEKRKDLVQAKGLGYIQTYWVVVKGAGGGSNASLNEEHLETSNIYGERLPGLDEKTCRLVDWNVETLLQILKQIVARQTNKVSVRKSAKGKSTPPLDLDTEKIPLECVQEIISLPQYDATAKGTDPGKVEIPQKVICELHSLVSRIASMYHDNPFHNFDHASHVVMSVTKLMSRIVKPSQTACAESKNSYGITNDPLTHFACAFSALIHDADHQGVSNAQLVKEGVPIASKYKERSVAEQNSFELSWDLLMSPEYKTLRSVLLPEESDMVRFKQLVLNSVMATDIVDKDLKNLRNGRWDKAFKKGELTASQVNENPRDAIDRKATIVIEHIIQASDISHTMQHWHIYRQWNQNLFEELYVAYLNGRMEKDPSEFWYKGEFGFFDFYIIPLTQKLKECGVFGVSSGEYLDYAKKNRAEWEAQGQAVVSSMIEECHRKYGVKEATVHV